MGVTPPMAHTFLHVDYVRTNMHKSLFTGHCSRATSNMVIWLSKYEKHDSHITHITAKFLGLRILL